MCNLIEDGDSRRPRLRLPRTHRWWLALRNRPRDPDDGSVARHLVASARGGARIPRRIEQVSLQLPVAATRGGIVQARLTFPTTPAKSDRKSTRLNSSHVANSYVDFCLK